MWQMSHSFPLWRRVCVCVCGFPGGTDGPEGVCQEAHQTEPSRQHQQQGEEENQELHDDEAQPERQN